MNSFATYENDIPPPQHNNDHNIMSTSIDLTGDDSSEDEKDVQATSINQRGDMNNEVGIASSNNNALTSNMDHHTFTQHTTDHSHGPNSSIFINQNENSPFDSSSYLSRHPHQSHKDNDNDTNGIVFTGLNMKSPTPSTSTSASAIAGPSHLGFNQLAPSASNSNSYQPNLSRHNSNSTEWNPYRSSQYPYSSHQINTNAMHHTLPSTGKDASSAIDLTSRNIPSPPPPPVNDKKPICIGSLWSQAIMLYPCPAVVVGSHPPPESKERYEVVQFRNGELLRVKLKHRAAGTPARKGEPNNLLLRDTIQVMTPSLMTFVGDLDAGLADPLSGLMQRGLVRLEGFVQRVQPEVHHFAVKINVLLFTLPSNVQYIANLLATLSQYLVDPIPPYDPSRHSEQPRYENAHGGGAFAAQMAAMAQRKAAMASGGYGMVFADKERDKATQVEVQRKQVDEVFKSLDNGGELEQSDPGPLIKTNLFPHQRRALTFFLQREQDSLSLKQAKKNAKKVLKKSKVDSSGESLWEGIRDEKGKIRSWKNKITGEETRARKGEKPDDSKGTILADDMGLGKTLSVVSLIAATRSSAHDWAKSKIENPTPTPSEPEKDDTDLKSSFQTKIFGMPDLEVNGVDSKGKKRKRDVDLNKALSSRRARIAVKSKGTLLVCPMSTISNWEDQIKEHWNGPVEIVGGAAGVMPPKVVERKWKPPKADGADSSEDELDNFDVLKVYIYHGPSRRPDPHFISDFDVVITSYNTLANEFSKQTGFETETNTPSETAENSGDEIDVTGDTSLNPRPTKPEVEAEIKAMEVAALMKSKKKSKGKSKVAITETSPLQAIDWFRVVLDEAHYIKTASTVASQAACALEADRRVALSGTPIQNKIEDVWALFKFLRVSPVDDKDVFTQYISSPCKYGEQIGVARLQLVMRCCTLRRTKDSTAEDGKRILNLPPRKEVQLWLELREDERNAYNERASAAKDRVGQMKEKNELSKNYANVLQEVLRLRQICNHVDLAMLGSVEEDYDGTVMDYQVAVKGIEANGLNQARAVAVCCFLKEGAGALCTGCNYDYGEYFPDIGLGGVEDFAEKTKPKKLNNKPVLTKCLHLYCPACFKNQVYSDYNRRGKSNVARACGTCNVMLRLPSDIIEVTPPECEANGEVIAEQPKRAARKKYVRPPGEKPNLSTKMQYLHDELLTLSKKNPNSIHYDPFAISDDGVEELDSDGKPLVTKSIVFSQWTTMLDRISDMLDEAQIQYARLDGTMTREERSRAIDALKFKKSTEVLLVSTRAGGVGLNLTVASRCYLVDPYWNPSVESQAIDRIHRMGQTRPVLAVKLMIKDSIEEKLDKIQKKKANLAQLSLKNMSRKELMAQKVCSGSRRDA
uniref:DNA repair protein RAD5 n=1 Tax=Kwoniella pini CBS 10737 TaxID=1296096 RepID=A0A1B9HV57_9TREE|nr:DNA repair protein RAD5 [Kwoniella pini CBS 10737]OCF47151.1 DNA repair protein RAD5 [Kwoniella pini CBS 10737]